MTGVETAVLVVGTVTLLGVVGVLALSVTAERTARRRTAPHPAAPALASLVRDPQPRGGRQQELVDELTDAVFSGILVRDLLAAQGEHRPGLRAREAAPDLIALARDVSRWRGAGAGPGAPPDHPEP